ncbi:trypsin-like peptidase domain-containing protein [Desulfomonile tiedjei]|uniref:Trypsin-like serine protease with C-terminal PDZ domain n=1 Tax=Desulfomonile tiedjei (strain ATCC 49306 / DSM 6799 / DCB-1) TaxID=706587 RepID=I4C663_DESTA|nr:trypsin-like peptidase domain-containing protein [Desulfomonile tiedjei]AFM25054.1 trypsin-like serine protease with C-terminal PDZ domain [Desulfomonile tiedjei DSM 6799]
MLSNTRSFLTPIMLPIVMAVVFLIFLPSIQPKAGAQTVNRNGLRDLQEAFRTVVKAAKPAVVNVSAVRNVASNQLDSSLDPFFENHPFRDLFKDELFRRFFGTPNPGKQYRQQGMASGFIFDPRGYILTNRHVIGSADQIVVTLESDKKYKARVIGADSKTDVAVIKIDGRGFPSAQLGDSRTLQVGDWVLAIGNPFGLMKTVTSGIVSATGRREMGILDYEDFIQTDAAINPGNSGGPLVNIEGQVIGMNTAILSRSGGSMGIGFAIPINIVKRILEPSMAGKLDPGKQKGTRPAQLDSSADHVDFFDRFLRSGSLKGEPTENVLRGNRAEQSLP